MRAITIQQEWLKPNLFLYSYNRFQQIHIRALRRPEDIIIDNDPVVCAKRYVPLIKTIRLLQGSRVHERRMWFVVVYGVDDEPSAVDIQSIALFISFALRCGVFGKIDQTDLKNLFYEPPIVHSQTYAQIITQLADYPVAADTFVRWCLENLNEPGFIYNPRDMHMFVSIREVVKSGIAYYMDNVHNNPEMKMVFIRIMEDYGLRDEGKELRL